MACGMYGVRYSSIGRFDWIWSWMVEIGFEMEDERLRNIGTSGGYVRPLGQAEVTPTDWRWGRFSPTAYTRRVANSWEGHLM